MGSRKHNLTTTYHVPLPCTMHVPAQHAIAVHVQLTRYISQPISTWKMSEMEELEAFFDLAESTVTYIKHCYEEGLDQDIKDNVLDLIEQVLQYGVLVLEVTDERVDTILGTLRHLAVAISDSVLLDGFS